MRLFANVCIFDLMIRETNDWREAFRFCRFDET
jgi:hypothetical protein